LSGRPRSSSKLRVVPSPRFSESSRIVVWVRTQLASNLKLKVSKRGSLTWAAAGTPLKTRANSARMVAIRRMISLQSLGNVSMS